MKNNHYIEESNLSVAWARALKIATARGRNEIAPLIVSVTGFDETGDAFEDMGIRGAIDGLLEREGKQGIDTVANTIFPFSLWNPSGSRQLLYDRYKRVAPRLRKASAKNRRGIYFDRMIGGGPEGKENQLEFAISTYCSRPGVRRSVLQIGVFNPGLDHVAAAQLGFPCLQHVTFAPTAEGLCINAFYSTQYLVERAYGNYVGLCRLGRFVAHELHMPLIRMTCFTGIAKCEFSKNKLIGILPLVDGVISGVGQQ